MSVFLFYNLTTPIKRKLPILHIVNGQWSVSVFLAVDSMYVRQENIYALMNRVKENIIIFIDPQFETVILVVLRDAF